MALRVQARMPSLEHNSLIAMFRENPPLAPRLLMALFHLDLPNHSSVRIADTALDQLIPVEFRADLLLELHDPLGACVLAIILEAQRDPSPRKKYSWPVYAVVARAERECPAIVLVIAPDAEVADWAGASIDLGLGLGTLRPLVLGPSTVPALTDPNEAEREVELAILSALAHGNGPQGLTVVQAALTALGRLDREHAAVYFHIIYEALREPIRRALEALVMERQAQGEIKYPPFVQKIFEEGELKGELKGELRGELKAKREVLLRLLSRAQLTLTHEEQARIQTCSEAALLDRWVDNVLGAKTAADVFS